MQADAKNRRQKIQELWEEEGQYNLYPAQLARAYNVSQSTIYDDIKAISKTVEIIPGDIAQTERTRLLKKVHAKIIRKVNNDALNERDQQKWTEIAIRLAEQERDIINEHNTLTIDNRQQIITAADFAKALEITEEKK